MTMRDVDTAVRELETKIGAGDRVAPEEPMVPSLPVENSGMRSVVRDMKDRAEAQMIKDALEVSGWNRRHAAKYLNISYRGLLYKIQQHISQDDELMGPACLTDSGPQRSARHTFNDLAGKFCKNLSCSQAHTHRIGHPLCG